MKIDKGLLPLKIHFFLASGGIAPVAPFLPVFAKQLGFTSVHFGWIQTVCPILVIILKPLAGAIIDRCKCHRPIFLIFLFLAGFFGFCIQWISPLPISSSGQVMCNDTLFISVCSEKLKEKYYADKLYYLKNSSVICKASIENNLLPKLFPNISHQSKDIISEKMDMNIVLGVSEIQDGCAIMKANNYNIPNAAYASLQCKTSQPWNLELNCRDTIIQSLLNNKSLSESEFFMTKQFLCLFFFTVGFLICYSISNTIADVVTFGLLGKKPQNYGVQRLWSPVGWGLSSIISGFVIDKLSEGKTEKDFTPAFYSMLILLSLDALVASRIKIVITEKSPNKMRDIKTLFKKPKVIIFVFWCFMNGVYFSFIWNFVLWFVEDLAAAGGSESQAWIKSLDGLILITQCYLGEIPFMFFSGKIIKKLGDINCMTLVTFAFGIRFLLYSILTNPWWVLPIESIQGITWGLMYSTMITHASAISPPGAETTVQNIFSSLFEGAGAAIGSLIGGYLVHLLGAEMTFLITGISAVLLAFLHMMIQKFLTTSEEPLMYIGANKEGEPLKGKEVLR